ncbi:hypothetical protein GN956_G25370 [Arapaima gigas]
MCRGVLLLLWVNSCQPRDKVQKTTGEGISCVQDFMRTVTKTKAPQLHLVADIHPQLTAVITAVSCEELTGPRRGERVR